MKSFLVGCALISATLASSAQASGPCNGSAKAVPPAANTPVAQAPSTQAGRSFSYQPGTATVRPMYRSPGFRMGGSGLRPAASKAQGNY